MFTGIVEEIGTVRSVGTGGDSARLAVDCAVVVADAAVGDSISVSGCCLTVTDRTDDGFVADLMGETLARTALGDLQAGDAVNLERSLRADGRLGGHLVQGHVDAVATVIEVSDEPGASGAQAPGRAGWTMMRFALPASIAPLVAEKGSIAVDGTSLTVLAVDDRSFAVGLIPHTLDVTVLGRRRVGDRVNVEADVVAKHVARLLNATRPLHRATPYDSS